LPAGDDIVGPQIAEDLRHTFARTHRNKAEAAFGLCDLAGRHGLGRGLYNLLRVLFPHVLDLDSGEVAVSQRLLQGGAGVVCMNVDFYIFFVINQNKAIAYGF
jgi:hypothetical protein